MNSELDSHFTMIFLYRKVFTFKVNNVEFINQLVILPIFYISYFNEVHRRGLTNIFLIKQFHLSNKTTAKLI